MARPQRCPGLPALLLAAALVGCGEDPTPSVDRPRIHSPASSVLPGPTVSGESFQYTYDAAGNLMAIQAAAPSVVAVAGFSPAAGGPGQPILVFGTGFSPVVAQNSVSIGAVPATVLAGSTSELVIVVPASATSAPIRVSTGADTAVSTLAFQVLTAVQILDFQPKLGPAGTWLEVEGVNFDPVAAANQLHVGGGSGEVLSASFTWMGALVGDDATAGKLDVISPAGHGTSLADFFLLPPGLREWEVGLTARTTVGAPEPLDIALDGQTGLILFDGVAGQHLTLHLTGVTLVGPAALSLLAPDGAALGDWSLASDQDAKLVVPTLPATGTYTIVIEPVGGGAGALDLQGLPDAAATLQPNVASQLSLVPGQNGRYAFGGSAGESLSLALGNLTMAPSGSTLSVTVLRPSGALLFGASGLSSPMSWRLPTLPEAGTYSIWVQPSGTASATFSLIITTPETATIAADGPAVPYQNENAGQATRLLFAGTAGQQIGLGLTELSILPASGGLALRLLSPTGATLWSSTATYATSWQLPKLAQDGTYALELTPPGTATVAASVLLTSAASGVLSGDGSPTVYSSSRVGQGGLYTFAGLAGQRLNLQATAGAGTGSFAVQVYPPSGGGVPYVSVPAGGDVKLALGALAVSGQYIVKVTPNGVAVGEVALRLVQAATGVVTTDAPPQAITLGAAQDGRFTFAGAAGDLLGLGIPSITTMPTGGSLAFKLLRPDGASLWTSTVSVATGFQWPVLPVSGEYILEVTPAGTAAAVATLLLSRPLASALVADGAATTFAGSRVAQSGRYVFSGTAGQRFTLRATASSLTNSIGVNVLRPDGASLVSTSLLSGNDKKLDLGALSATGTYTVAVVPTGAALGQVALALVSGASGTLVINGAPTLLRLGAAQNGRYGFSATSGAALKVVISQFTTSPVGSTVTLSVLRPDGTTLWSGVASKAATYQLPTLAVSGTYTLVLQPAGTAAADVTLQLTRP